MGHWSNRLKSVGACGEAIAWCATQKTRKAAWENCERGDWMLWAATNLCVDRKVVVLAACTVARQALAHSPAGETRPLRAIETAEAWARGEQGVTLEMVWSASANASASASASAAASAASVSAYAYASAYASAAASAAAYAASANARQDSLKSSADIVRRMIPMPTLSLVKKKVAA